MNNKILIELIVPDIGERYNLFIPINRRVGSIIILLNKLLYEITNGVFFINNDRTLYNRFTGEEYQINDLIRNTNIRNGTKLVLL